MRNSMFTKLATFCFLGFILTYPLESLGFKLGFFRVSIPMLFMYACAPFALLCVKWDKLTFGLYLGLLTYFLMITMPRWPAGMVIKPMAALILISMVIFMRPTGVRVKHVYLMIHLGLIMDLVFCLLNVAIYYGGVGTSLRAVLGDLYVGNSYVLKAGLLRMQGAFTEPAHHSIYCAFLLLVMFNFNYLKTGKLWFRLVMMALTSGLLLFSFSMTGYLLFLTVIGVQVFFGRVSGKLKVGVAILGLVFLIFAWFHPGTYRSTYGRIEPILDSFHGVSKEDGNWDSARTAPFRVAVEYVQEEGAKGFFIGEGYGNFEYWVAHRYMGMMTSFAMGQVANLTVALFLGTGVFGVVLFYLLIYARFRNLHWRDKVLWFTFLQVFFFAYGIIVNHMLWGMLIMFRVLTDMNRDGLFAGQDQHQLRHSNTNRGNF
jgi:hypothetical protein